MTAVALFTQLFAVTVAVVLAPLFLGWVNMCRAWLQNRAAPPLTQPYRMIRKLLRKEAAIREEILASGAAEACIDDAIIREMAKVWPKRGTEIPVKQFLAVTCN